MSKQDKLCPCCGRCPVCGRSEQVTVPQPVVIRPQVPTYPYVPGGGWWGIVPLSYVPGGWVVTTTNTTMIWNQRGVVE